MISTFPEVAFLRLPQTRYPELDVAAFAAAGRRRVPRGRGSAFGVAGNHRAAAVTSRSRLRSAVSRLPHQHLGVPSGAPPGRTAAETSCEDEDDPGKE